jgi:hypothetical protein
MKLLLALLIWMTAAGAQASPCLSGGELAQGIIRGTIPAVADRKSGGFLYEASDAQVCLFMKNKKKQDVVKTTEISAEGRSDLKKTAALPPKPMQTKRLVGTWHNGGDARISFSRAKNQVLYVKGYSQFENSSGSIRVGEFDGKTDVKSIGHQKTRISSIGVDGAEANEACYIDVQLIGSLLVVLDSGEILGKCGGYGATFSGVYAR